MPMTRLFSVVFAFGFGYCKVLWDNELFFRMQEYGLFTDSVIGSRKKFGVD